MGNAIGCGILVVVFSSLLAAAAASGASLFSSRGGATEMDEIGALLPSPATPLVNIARVCRMSSRACGSGDTYLSRFHFLSPTYAHTFPFLF